MGVRMPQHELVVIGLGYVGLPLAIEAVSAGMRVSGLERATQRVQALNDGRSYVDGVSDAQLQVALLNGFRATCDPACLSTADTIVICVPTPLRDSIPDLAAVLEATTDVASRLRSGTLVVLESTTYPGTTTEIVLPMLQERGASVGSDFHLAFSPERIDPGNREFGLRNTPKVVGGVTELCAEAAVEFYSRLVDRVVQVSSPAVAELTKLLENTYRQVNIALMNEMAVFCSELDIDLWEAIDAAATKPFGFQPFRPGPGVGGHCIPIDPNYLSYRVRALGYPFRFVELAHEINNRMPVFVTDRIIRLLNDRTLSVRGARILLLGVTYKADIADLRESPALTIADRLLDLGALLEYHDPYVDEWYVNGQRLTCVESLATEAAAAHVTVLLQDHQCYDLDDLAGTARVLLDTRGRAKGKNVVRL
jgi:UDP-N-acetyl-D-glucosamine dehydrogenase